MPLLVNDVAADPATSTSSPAWRRRWSCRCSTRRRPIGALNVLSHHKDQFTAADVELLRQFAAHVAVALVNARLFERSRADAEAFETLAEIGRDVASVLELDELFARIAQSTRRLIDYRTFGIWLVNEERGELEIKLAVQYGEQVHVHAACRSARGWSATPRSTRSRCWSPTCREDPRYINVVPDVRSELAIPMMLKDRCIGVLDLESPELDAFTKRDVEILTAARQPGRGGDRERAALRDRPRQRGPSREGDALRAARAGGAAAGRPAEADEGRRRRRAGSRRRASSAATSTTSCRRKPNMLAVALGDVSGKGVPAALYSVFAAELIRGRTFRRRYLPDRSGPASVLSSVNTILHQRQLEEYYCTLCYAIFDLKRRIVTLANSGLPYPIRASAEGVSQIELPGVPLGSFPGSAYDELTFALHPGDLFVFCSDGVSEAMNVNGEEFGSARLIEVVEQSRELHAARAGRRDLRRRRRRSARASRRTTT